MAEFDHHGNEIPAPNFTKRELWKLVVRQGGKANISSNAGHAALDAEWVAQGSRQHVMPGQSKTPRKDRNAD